MSTKYEEMKSHQQRQTEVNTKFIFVRKIDKSWDLYTTIIGLNRLDTEDFYLNFSLIRKI